MIGTEIALLGTGPLDSARDRRRAQGRRNPWLVGYKTEESSAVPELCETVPIENANVIFTLLRRKLIEENVLLKKLAILSRKSRASRRL